MDGVSTYTSKARVTAAAPSTKQTSMDDLVERMMMEVDRLRSIRGRLVGLQGRLCGATPEMAEDGPSDMDGRVVPHPGVIAVMARLGDARLVLMGECGDILTELEGLL